MANKIRNSLEWYYQRLVNDPCEHTYNDFKVRCNELMDLVYKMWLNDLISDKVKEKCYEVFKEYGFKTIKYIF